MANEDQQNETDPEDIPVHHEVGVAEVLRESGGSVSVSASNQTEIPIFGEIVPMLFEPRCKTCTTTKEVRAFIEVSVLSGASYREIFESLPEGTSLLYNRMGEKVSYDTFRKGLARHYGKGEKDADGNPTPSHSSVNITVASNVMDAVYKHFGADQIEETIISTHVGLHSTYLRLREDFMQGRMKTTVSDMLAVMDRIERLKDADAGRSNAELFTAAVEAMVKEVRRYLPPDSIQALVSTLESNEVFMAGFAAARAEAAGELPNGS